MGKKWIFGLRLCWYSMALVMVALPAVTGADENVSEWLRAAPVALRSDVSLLSYGAFGLGRYPYHLSDAGIPMTVLLDGIPVTTFSPFGTDIDLIPPQVVDSVAVTVNHELEVFTRAPSDDEPVTVNGFLLGQRRRFTYDFLLSRMTGQQTGFVAAGSSSGVHALKNMEKTVLRNYFLKIDRSFDNGARFSTLLRVFRDRDGLIDLDRGVHMGERRTDHRSVSFTLDGVPLADSTVLLSAVYAQGNLSRFERYGVRRSLDDDMTGLFAELRNNRGNTTVSLATRHGFSGFDSRIHDVEWHRYTGDVVMEYTRTQGSMVVDGRGGFRYSSKYGGGLTAAVSLSYRVSDGLVLMMNGLHETKYPDAADEYYPALIFSDETMVADLERFTVSTAEAGIRQDTPGGSVELYGFVERSDAPRFFPSSNAPAQAVDPGRSVRMMQSPYRTVSGIRGFWRLEGGAQVPVHSELRFAGRHNTGNDDAIWPYPAAELNEYLDMGHRFFGNRLYALAFTQVAVRHWNNGPATPDGTRFLMDLGLLLTVSTLEIFYKVENLTGSRTEWFDGLGWTGRNSMWGCSWVLSR